MAGMDFTPLTDDPLVELVRAACAECAKRGTDVEGAARAAMLSEAEKMRIAQQAREREADRIRQEEAARIAQSAAAEVRRQAEARQNAQAQSDCASEAQKETERQAALWAKKEALATRVVELLGKGWTVTVWQNADGKEMRVYLDCERNKAKISYYKTGNERHKPDSVESHNLSKLFANHDAKRDAATEVCRDACRQWSHLRLDCDEAAPNAAYKPSGEEEEERRNRILGGICGERAVLAVQEYGRLWLIMYDPREKVVNLSLRKIAVSALQTATSAEIEIPGRSFESFPPHRRSLFPVDQFERLQNPGDLPALTWDDLMVIAAKQEAANA